AHDPAVAKVNDRDAMHPREASFRASRSAFRILAVRASSGRGFAAAVDFMALWDGGLAAGRLRQKPKRHWRAADRTAKAPPKPATFKARGAAKPAVRSTGRCENPLRRS